MDPKMDPKTPLCSRIVVVNKWFMFLRSIDVYTVSELDRLHERTDVTDVTDSNF